MKCSFMCLLSNAVQSLVAVASADGGGDTTLKSYSDRTERTSNKLIELYTTPAANFFTGVWRYINHSKPRWGRRAHLHPRAQDQGNLGIQITRVRGGKARQCERMFT